MLKIEFKYCHISFELYYIDKVFGVRLIYKNRLWSYEKGLFNKFKCSMCGDKVEYQDSSLKLCEDCLPDFISFWEKKIK